MVAEKVHERSGQHHDFPLMRHFWNRRPPDALISKTSIWVVMKVPRDPTQIRGLGFIGLMRIGAHHQDHHLMLAQGVESHRRALSLSGLRVRLMLSHHNSEIRTYPYDGFNSACLKKGI